MLLIRKSYSNVFEVNIDFMQIPYCNIKEQSLLLNVLLNLTILRYPPSFSAQPVQCRDSAPMQPSFIVQPHIFLFSLIDAPKNGQ